MKLKKMISYLLTIMILTMFIPTSYAKAATPFLSSDKTSFLVGDAINIAVTGLTSAQINDNSAFIGLYHKGDKQDAGAITSIWASNLPGNNIWQFKAPTALGDFEVRLYWEENGTDKWIETLSIKVTSSQAKVGDLTISSDKFLVNDNIKVTITGLTDGQIDDSAWAGLYHEGDAMKADSISYVWIDSFKDGKTWEFKAPTELGNYEIRVFTKDVDKEVREQALFGKLTFSVVSNPAKDGDLKISGDRFLANDVIKVTIKGLTDGQIDDGAWAGLYRVSDEFKTDSLQYIWISNFRDGKTWEFKAPTEYGKYEIRVFTKDIQKEQREKALFGRLPFIVGSNPAQKGDIKLNKEAYKMEENVVVSIKGLTPGQIEDGAWIGLYRPTDDFKAESLQYTFVENLRDGKTWTFKAPSEPGVFEVRVFTQDIAKENRELAFFGRVPFTVLKQTIVTKDDGAFNWANYTMKVTPTTQIVVNKGKTSKVKVTALRNKLAPVPANVLAKYSIKDTQIATVDRTGIVKGNAKGTTTLTITGGKNKVVLKVIVK